jgi:hypothetical protein
MITFLGILILLVGIADLVLNLLRKNVETYNQEIAVYNTRLKTDQEAGNRRYEDFKYPKTGNFPDIPGKFWMWIVSGIAVISLQWMFFWANPTEQYFLVYPTGQTGVVTSQGIKWRGFAKITPWQKYIDIKVVGKDDEGNYKEDVSELEGILDPVHIRFIDQVTANAYVSTRFQLPSDEPTFMALAIKFRTMSNLVNNTLMPAVKEQVNNTGYMFKAQNYISGEAQNFRQTLDEMLKDGAYAVNKITTKDTILTDTASRMIKEIKTSYNVEKRMDRNGKFIRIPHEITSNNIIVSQVIVDDVYLEKAFRERLKKQRDEAAKRQLERQKTETAKDAQTRIIAEGERDKAAERVTQEKEQVKTLIAIETKLKQEETNKKLATIQLQTEKIQAEQRKVKADAEAYEIKKKVVAGITPEVRLQMELDAKVAVAAEIATLKLPATYISGSGKGGNSSILYDLLGADYAKNMLNTK